MVVKARVAKGPAWDCSKAWLVGGIAAWSSLCMAVWTGIVARSCHPGVLGASSVFASVALGWIPCALGPAGRCPSALQKRPHLLLLGYWG